MNPTYLLLRAILFTLWPAVAFASTTVTLGSTLDGIDAGAWLIVFILSTMGGLTSLLHRLKQETPPRMLLYVLSHMLMAWFAGVGSFFVMEYLNWPDLAEIPAIAFCAFMGARFVDVIAERMIRVVESRIGGGDSNKPNGV